IRRGWALAIDGQSFSQRSLLLINRHCSIQKEKELVSPPSRIEAKLSHSSTPDSKSNSQNQADSNSCFSLPKIYDPSFEETRGKGRADLQDQEERSPPFPVHRDLSKALRRVHPKNEGGDHETRNILRLEAGIQNYGP